MEALHKLWFFRLARYLSFNDADCVEISLTFRLDVEPMAQQA